VSLVKRERQRDLTNSITLSPVYPAAASQLGSERGLSIRFPRFMKLRDDKSWEQATTSDQFASMYRKQIVEAPARSTGPDGAGAAQIRRVSEDRDVEEVEGEEDDAEVEDAVSGDE
jgi:DNA ligase-1